MELSYLTCDDLGRSFQGHVGLNELIPWKRCRLGPRIALTVDSKPYESSWGEEGGGLSNVVHMCKRKSTITLHSVGLESRSWAHMKALRKDYPMGSTAHAPTALRMRKRKSTITLHLVGLERRSWAHMKAHGKRYPMESTAHAPTALRMRKRKSTITLHSVGLERRSWAHMKALVNGYPMGSTAHAPTALYK